MLGPLRQNLWWQSPTHWDGLIISGTQLAQIAGMPTSTAYAVLQDLDRMGWIAHRRGLAVRLTRPEHVCADWLLLARRQTTTRLPIRPIFPSKNANEDPLQTMARLAGRLPHKSWAIGGWAACRLFNLDIVTEAERFPILIRTQGNAQDAMEAMECSICEPAQAIAYLEPAAGRHALAGSRMCGNIPIVDVIQAALDVASDSSRGVQQAEHIADLVAHHYQKAMASVSV
jgi:hypothetical protein